MTTIGARAPQLADLIENANTTFTAIGDAAEQASPPGLKQLPVTLRQGNRTFAELPADVHRAETARERLQADHASR